MYKKYLTALLLLLFSLTAAAVKSETPEPPQPQQFNISPDAEISVLTIGPGNYLSDAFGHSAIRVKDARRGMDLVFNWGVYDFDTPNFYLQFARGFLPYQMGINRYSDFMASYKRQDRWIKEQVLDLNAIDKKAVIDFLDRNARPENLEYQYDFFYDNCATKIPEVLDKSLDDRIIFDLSAMDTGKTFRDLIHDNAHWNTWGRVGMDIAIGSVTDREATPQEHLFLPDYVLEAFAKAELETPSGQVPLVKETNTLHDAPDDKPTGNFLFSPLVVFSILGFLILYRTYRDDKEDVRSRGLDTALFVFTGLVGVFVLLLWFGTEHSTTKNNYELLWAFALNLLMAPVAWRTKPFVQFIAYIKFLIILLALMAFHWISGVQGFAIAMLPFFIALAVRYFYILRYFKRHPLGGD